jgi:hypothetical protein
MDIKNFIPEDRDINVRDTTDSVGRPVSIEADGNGSVIVMNLSEGEAFELHEKLAERFTHKPFTPSK